MPRGVRSNRLSPKPSSIDLICDSNRARNGSPSEVFATRKRIVAPMVAPITIHAVPNTLPKRYPPATESTAPSGSENAATTT